MTQDDIIQMALEAGYKTVYLADVPIGRSYQFLERFAALVAAHEREKQAEQEPVAWIDNKTWCFTYSQYEYEDLDDDMTDDLVPLYAVPVSIEAAAIRARGEK